MCNKDHYYIQGFKVPASISTVDFVQDFCGNRIELNTHLTVHFRPGASTMDFESIILQDPTLSELSIDSDKLLKAQRRVELSPVLIKCNDHIIEVYDLDGRVFNYVVTSTEDTALVEDPNSTNWIINESIVSNLDGSLGTIIEKSKYICWDSLPINENYSYQHINTTSGTSSPMWLLAQNSENVAAGEFSGVLGASNSSGAIMAEAIAEHNNPIDFNTYTKWRLELANILVSFYDALYQQVPDEYTLYIDGVKTKCLDSTSAKKIDISFQGFGNLRRRAHMYNPDLYQSSILLNIRISTPDQLEYMELKKKYQNYMFLTDLVKFQTQDKLGLDWTSHIWWEDYKDNQSMKQSRDTISGTKSFNLETQCTIHFYEVEDRMYRLISQLRLVFANLPQIQEYVFTLQTPEVA